MDETGVASPEPLIDTDAAPPAPGADDQKPNAEPAPAADDQNAEAETPEQQEAKRESRRARSNARKAAELASARTEARLLREQLAKHEARPQPESGEPKREQFEDYESYLRAVTRYDAKQEAAAALRTEREASQRREQQGRETAGQAKTAQAWVEREKAFQAATKDYQEVVTEYVNEDLGNLSDVARRAIVDSDVGPQVLHYLAQHSDDHDRIAALPAGRQAAEIGKLELKLSVPAKKASDAPPPVKPVGQGRSASNGYHENMTPAEYREWRKAQGARWAH